MPSIDRPLHAPELVLGLEEETAALREADTWLRAGRSARTLVKAGPLRVTLVAVAPAGSIAPHHAEGPITVQVLEGEVLFRAGGREHPLRVGDLLALEAGVRHSVESRTGGVFLLTAALPAAGQGTEN